MTAATSMQPICTIMNSVIFILLTKFLLNMNFTVSQKTSRLRLAITSTHVNGFWYFLAHMLPIK